MSCAIQNYARTKNEGILSRSRNEKKFNRRHTFNISRIKLFKYNEIGRINHFLHHPPNSLLTIPNQSLSSSLVNPATSAALRAS